MTFAADRIFTHSQLRQGGLQHSEITARTREGLLHRLRRGVYCTPEELDQVQAHLRLVRATLQSVDPSNVVSHESAALLHGLPVPNSSPDQVTMTRRTSGHTHTTPLLRVRNTPLLDDEVTTVDGIAVTTLSRTVVDLARLLPYDWGVAASDAALKAGLPREELIRTASRHPRLRGLPKARAAIEFADDAAESPAESLSRVQFARHGIPKPQLQFNVVDRLGVVVARTDFGWPEFRLVGEVDGKWKYGQLLRPGQSPESAIMREKRREELIRQAGYWIVRWGWETLQDGRELARLVRNAVDLQRA